MKKAEDWIREYKSDRHLLERKLMFRNGDLIRAIQLDAVLEAIPLIEKIGTTGVERTDIILKAEKWLARIRELEAAPEKEGR